MEKEIKIIRQADLIAFAHANITDMKIMLESGGKLTSSDIQDMITSLNQMFVPIICDFCASEAQDIIVLCDVDVDCYDEHSDEKIVRNIHLCEGCVNRMSEMFAKRFKRKTK